MDKYEMALRQATGDWERDVDDILRDLRGMLIRDTLTKNTIDPYAPVFKCTNEQAMMNLQDRLDSYGINFQLTNLTTEEMKELLQAYSNSISYYQPERGHQERGALLQIPDTLMRHGVTQEQLNEMEF